MLQELRDLDLQDIGSSSLGVKLFILVLIAAAILLAGYHFMIKDKRAALMLAQNQEGTLRSEFETKQQKAANLSEYETQLEEMKVLLEAMLRQLPSKTEMDKLLVDVSQTALASGIENQLFQPGPESILDFYAERPITIRMQGTYHQFGDFVSGVASLPRVVIMTMHDIALRRSSDADFRSQELTLEGTVKTYRYVDEAEQAALSAEES